MIFLAVLYFLISVGFALTEQYILCIAFGICAGLYLAGSMET